MSVRTIGSRPARAFVAAAALLALLLLLGSAAAAPGDLDPSFGTAGTVQTAIGSAAIANSIAIQPDGKILLAGASNPGGIALARYMLDGALDASFGTGGIVTGPEGAATALAVQTDGKIVVAGRLTEPDADFAVMRYEANGAVDTSFGQSGVATGPYGDARALAIEPNGRIVVAGYGPNPQRTDRDTFLLARFTPEGTPDLGFGSNGVVRTEIGLSASAVALALQRDGKVVVGGSSTPDATPPYVALALARYLPNGTLDQAFGSDGIVSTPIVAGFHGGSGLVLQPDGRIVVTGSSDNDFALVRYKPDGTLDDETFGDFGSTTTEIGPSTYANAIALEPGGSIVIAGSSGDAFVLARYSHDGELDPGFGTGGVATNTIGLRGGANALAIQSDGRLLGAGWASDGSMTRFVLGRYRATTPSTIQGSPLIIDYGKELRVHGTLTDRQPGAPVTLVRRTCYAFSPTSGPKVYADSDGDWAARFRPQSRTAFWVNVGSDRSSPLTVRVRPRVSIRRLPKGFVRANVLFVHSLADSKVVLQSYSPSARHWLDEREATLRRVSRKPAAVVSGATFRMPARPRRWFRVLVRQIDQYSCFATASSRAIRR